MPMTSIRKEAPGLYQIGIYTVMKTGSCWSARSTGALGSYEKSFPTLAAAHLQLTGEQLRTPRETFVSKRTGKTYFTTRRA